MHYCAIFQKLDCRPFPDFKFPFPLKAQKRADTCRGNQEAMLVDVVEFVENPKLLVPSLVRLQSLDESHCGPGDSLYFGAASGFQFLEKVSKVFGLSKNREAVFSGGLVASGVNELPDEVIQSGSQIVENITDDDGQGQGNWRARWKAVDLIAGLRVVLGVDGIRVRVEKSVNPSLKVTDVLFGPFDFCPDAE
jgi:hypothetical protein